MNRLPKDTKQVELREYSRSDSVVFFKTREEFGGLSNMASNFPIVVNGTRIGTSEAIYQACRFPHLPEVQEKILSEASPMTAKMRAKPFRGETRADWDNVRVRVMRWAIRLKLAYNFHRFRDLLLSTGKLPIVEFSKKDRFWGAAPVDENMLVGANVLGRLLMQCRESLHTHSEPYHRVIQPLDIPSFLLLGLPILVSTPNPKWLEQEPQIDQYPTRLL